MPLKKLVRTEFPQCTKDSSSWIYKQRIGKSSSYGEVWQACCEKDCQYVAKYQKFGVSNQKEFEDYYTNITPEDIEKEVKLQDAIANIGLSVPILDSWLCKHGGVMIMRALKSTVSDLFLEYHTKTVRAKIVDKILKLIKKLHKNGFYHGDTHFNNVMVDYDPENYIKSYEKYPNNETKRYDEVKYKYYFIDMGRSGYLEKNTQKQARKDDFIKVYTDLNHLISSNEKLENMNSILEDVIKDIISI